MQWLRRFKEPRKIPILRNASKLLLGIMVAAVLASGCVAPSQPQPTPTPTPTRAESIPDDAVKITAQTDLFPPVVHSVGWDEPVPMVAPITTAGAEDSPFITPDGNTFYFFFTPDVDVPANEQLFDGVTGIWWSKRAGGAWSEPQRIILNDDLSLEGCPFVQGDTMWFCSVRNGNYGEVDFYTAKYVGEEWTDWENAGQRLNEQYTVGELHISTDGGIMYFGWEAPGGYGGRDIWKLERTDGEWGGPVNLGPTVNSDGNEDLPFLSSDGDELWFSGQSRLGYPGPAVFRSVKSGDGSWSEPEEIISSFAGEPTLDDQGNIYFVHHFFDEDIKMVEADIYVAYRR